MTHIHKIWIDETGARGYFLLIQLLGKLKNSNLLENQNVKYIIIEIINLYINLQEYT